MKYKKYKYILLSLIGGLLLVELLAYVLLVIFVDTDFEKSYNKKCEEVISSATLDHGFKVIYKKGTNCLHKKVNSFGFMSTEFPTKKNKRYFTIMVLGGSVAEAMYLTDSVETKDPASGMTKLLRAKFGKINGREIRVINGSRIDFRQPQQLQMLIEFGHTIDGVISVEGYNEMEAIVDKFFIPSAPVEYYVLRTYSRVGRELEIREAIRQSSLLKHSSIVKIIYSYLLVDPRNKANSVKAKETSYGGKNNVTTEESIQKYKNYIGAMNKICELHKLVCNIFFQPMPMIGKKLTEEEHKHSFEGDEYARVLSKSLLYKKITDRFLTHKFSNIKLHSLLYIFSDIEYKIYYDWIHYKTQESISEPGGYELMQLRIVNLLNLD